MTFRSTALRGAAAAVSLSVLAAVSAATAVAEEAPALDVREAAARFDIDRRTGAPRDALTLRGRLPDAAAARDFDPAADAVRATVSGVDVIDAAPPFETRAFRAWSRRGEIRRWRLRDKGPAGTVGSRVLVVDARRGTFRLTVRRADLHAVRDAGPADVTVALTLGSATAETTFTFRVIRASSPAIWRFRDIPSPPGPPGPPGPPRPPGAMAFASLTAGSLANTPRPDVEVARDAAAFSAVWSALGSPGPLPAVDFERDMVIVVSSLVTGPGTIPPQLTVLSVNDTGTAVDVEWALMLCEEPNQCPGAPWPVECPTATPFHVFSVGQTPGDVTLRQSATVWVCP